MDRKKDNNKVIKALIFLVILLLLVPGLFSLSKYVYNSVRDYYLETKGFYFNSDKLSDNHSEMQIENNWSGAESYAITINLNSKKNDLLFCETDIDYEISYTCSSNITCTSTKESGTIEGTNSGGLNEDYFILTINPSGGVGLQNGEQAWVDVEVKSTSPYVKTLSGRMYVGVSSSDITYNIMDSVNSPYIKVNITNSLHQDEDVTLTFDPNVILLDMTNQFAINATNMETEQINNYNYVNSVTTTLGSLETTTVTFYKVDPAQDYTYQEGDKTTPIITLTY